MRQFNIGTSPPLHRDPRAIKCECGRLLYPGQVCICREPLPTTDDMIEELEVGDDRSIP